MQNVKNKNQEKKIKPNLEKFKYEAAQEFGISHRGEHEKKRKNKK